MSAMSPVNLCDLPAPRDITLFRNLAASEVQHILSSAQVRRFSRNTVITQQTEPAEHFFLLWRGRARYFFETPSGKKLILRWLVPGQVFGVSGLVEGPSTYLVSVEAVKDSVTLIWTDATIRDLARRFPHLLENALLISSRYLSWYVAAHAGLASQTASERLAHVLCGLAEVTGRKLPAGTELDVTNEELANAANISPYTASRVTSNWQLRGIIRRRRGKIVLCSVRRLFSHH
jgi:CRP-like cAMP-binding protein